MVIGLHYNKNGYNYVNLRNSKILKRGGNDKWFCKSDDIINGYMTYMYMWITLWKLGISMAKKKKVSFYGNFTEEVVACKMHCKKLYQSI